MQIVEKKELNKLNFIHTLIYNFFLIPIDFEVHKPEKYLYNSDNATCKPEQNLYNSGNINGRM